jgi:PAS domain-containing protein
MAESTETGIKIVTAIATGITSIYIFYKKLIHPQVKKRQKETLQKELEMEEMLKALKQIPGLVEKIEQIKQQVFPYGKAGLLEVIEIRFDSIDARLDNLEDNNIIFNNMQNVAFWVSDLEGHCTYASPMLCKMLERSESEILGLNWLSSLVKEDMGRIGQGWMQSIEENRVFDEIYAFRGIDGHPIRVHGFAIHKKNRKTNTYSGSIGTITKSII